MVQEPRPIRDAVEGAVGAVLDRLGRSPLFRRRLSSRPISVGGFISASFQYYPPETKPPRFSDFVPRTDKAGRNLVQAVVGLLGGGRAILAGEGGVGKSTLAYQAAAHYASRHRVGLAWVSADGAAGFSLAHFVAALAGRLGCAGDLQAVCNALREGPHVVVLDNCDTVEDRSFFLSLAQSFPTVSRLLLTTRHVDERFRGLGDAVTVEPMSEREALVYAAQEAKRQELALRKETLREVARQAHGNPEVIRWLLGHARWGRLTDSLRDLRAGGGLAGAEAEGPGRVFGRTWSYLSLRERTVLCVLSLLPNATRDLLADATSDPQVAQTLEGLSRWHLARTDDLGRTWSVTGLTRELARPRLYPVLDDWRRELEAGGERGQAAAWVLASFLASGALQQALDRMGHWNQRVIYGEAALEAARRLGGERLLARAAHHLAMAFQDQGRYPEAERLYQESLEIGRRLGDQAGIASSLHQLGMLAQHQGRYPEAERLYQESLEILRRLGDQAGIARSLHQLGILAEQRGDLAQSEDLLRQALEILQRLGSPQAEQARRDLERIRQKRSQGPAD